MPEVCGSPPPAACRRRCSHHPPPTAHRSAAALQHSGPDLFPCTTEAASVSVRCPGRSNKGCPPILPQSPVSEVAEPVKVLVVFSVERFGPARIGVSAMLTSRLIFICEPPSPHCPAAPTPGASPAKMAQVVAAALGGLSLSSTPRRVPGSRTKVSVKLSAPQRHACSRAGCTTCSVSARKSIVAGGSRCFRFQPAIVSLGCWQWMGSSSACGTAVAPQSTTCW